MPELTKRQQQILDVILNHMREHQCPPAFRDIMEVTGIKSTHGITVHLATLQEKGLISWGGSASRSIRVNLDYCPYCGKPRDGENASKNATKGDPEVKAPRSAAGAKTAKGTRRAAKGT